MVNIKTKIFTKWSQMAFYFTVTAPAIPVSIFCMISLLQHNSDA